jgi:ABC-type cobalamin/Fe3+-siderophores transport system ATPase subunit
VGRRYRGKTTAPAIVVIDALAAQGVNIVFTTHHPNLALSLAGQAILMRRGAVLAAGSGSDHADRRPPEYPP